MPTNLPKIEQLTWSDVKPSISKINSAFSKQVDAAKHLHKLAIYRVRYTYGLPIFQHGELHLPHEDGSTKPLSELDDSIKLELNYAEHLPLGMVTKKSAESFLTHDNTPIPVTFRTQGDLFGLSQVLNNNNSNHLESLCNMTAGARCTFILPKISNSISHKNLQNHYGINDKSPKNSSDHFELFKSIIYSEKAQCNWEAEILFFSKDWIEAINKDDSFSQYLKTLAIEEASSMQDRSIYDYLFSCVQRDRKMKENPYLVDTVKQLFLINSGKAPGFGIYSDEEAMPIRLIQEAYLERYELKLYSPIIMGPMYIHNKNKQPVYYSLTFPTLTNFTPASRYIASMMLALHDIQSTVEIFQAYLKTQQEKGNPTVKRLKNIGNFEIFHTQEDRNSKARPAVELLDEDKPFSSEVARFTNLSYPENAQFFKGSCRLMLS